MEGMLAATLSLAVVLLLLLFVDMSGSGLGLLPYHVKLIDHSIGEGEISINSTISVIYLLALDTVLLCDAQILF